MLQRSHLQLQTSHLQSGQTLIETIAAIFILATALTTGLALAIYALSTSTTSKNQFIAANLAREGVEVVRMIRDSNWLAAGAAGPPSQCADLGGRPCFPTAFNIISDYVTSYSNPGDFFTRVGYDRDDEVLGLDNDSGTRESFMLCLWTDGRYMADLNGSRDTIIQCDPPSTPFARRIIISTNSNAPYTPQNPEYVVRSIVAWNGKNCPILDLTTVLSPAPGACKVIVEERFNNWKDYR